MNLAGIPDDPSNLIAERTIGPSAGSENTASMGANSLVTTSTTADPLTGATHRYQTERPPVFAAGSNASAEASTFDPFVEPPIPNTRNEPSQ